MTASILDLSDDLLQTILLLLPLETAMDARLLCRRFQNLFIDEHIWKQLCLLNKLVVDENGDVNWKGLVGKFCEVRLFYSCYSYSRCSFRDGVDRSNLPILSCRRTIGKRAGQRTQCVMRCSQNDQ